MGMPDPVRAHGSAVTVVTVILTMIVTIHNPNGTMGAVDVADFLVPQQMDGTAETLHVEIQGHGSQGARAPFGSAVRALKIEPKNAANEDRFHICM